MSGNIPTRTGSSGTARSSDWLTSPSTVKLARGKSTSFVVLQLQRDLTAARNSEIRALADYNRQVSALARAEGAMLERHGVEFAGE